MTRSTASPRTSAGPHGNIGRSHARRAPLDAVAVLASLVAVLAAVAAGVGLLSRGGSGPASFTTLHGKVVQIYGRGLYRNDTLFTGALNRGTDAATLLVAVPLLIVAVRWYRTGSPRGTLMLTGVLAYFLYVYASLALGAAAYNDLFLVYVALFSASLFALVRCMVAMQHTDLAAHSAPRMPRRSLGAFLLVCGAVTTGVWLGMGLLPAMITGESGRQLHGYTTYVTTALDVGIITPACYLAGILLLRRAPAGYAIACALLGILTLLGPAFVAQPISQIAAGVRFSPGEIIGPIAGFGILAAVAIGFSVVILRNTVDTARPRVDRHHRARSRPVARS